MAEPTDETVRGWDRDHVASVERDLTGAIQVIEVDPSWSQVYDLDRLGEAVVEAGHAALVAMVEHRASIPVGTRAQDQGSSFSDTLRRVRARGEDLDVDRLYERIIETLDTANATLQEARTAASAPDDEVTGFDPSGWVRATVTSSGDLRSITCAPHVGRLTHADIGRRATVAVQQAQQAAAAARPRTAAPRDRDEVLSDLGL